MFGSGFGCLLFEFCCFGFRLLVFCLLRGVGCLFYVFVLCLFC